MPEPAVILQFLAVASAIAYLPFISRQPAPNRSALKTLPVSLLCLAALLGGLSPFIVAALAACAAGDFFLSLEGENNFLSGLGAFLAGHLFYTAYFASQIDTAHLAIEPVLLTAFILAALIALLLVRLWPFLGQSRTPVFAYSIAIAAMALSAKAAHPAFGILAGISMLIVSDIVLAIDRFTPLSTSIPRRLMPYAVWLLYAAGQVCIVYGFSTA